MWNVTVQTIIKSHLTSNHCADLDVDTIHLQRCRTLANTLLKVSNTYNMVGTLDFAVLVWEGPPCSTQKLVLKKPNSHTLIRCSSLPTHFSKETAARSLVGNQDEYQSLWNQSLPVMQTLQNVSPHGKNHEKPEMVSKQFKLLLYRHPYIWDSIIWVAFVTEIGLPGSNDKEMIGTITPGLWRDLFTSKKNRKLDNSLGQPSTWNKCIIYFVHISACSTKSRNGMLSQEILHSHSM